ncbi:Uu.00g059630.m01.CDS01 [Anthostomella pinea]|uniref:Uu.00g059630.m01.CDS01 n=1 Tax=Anthostomella pinea TaxID=933095 RepID=A0AAI8VSY0_9PEZI|nr:Uu.00g059630.m01.CDS01 [Anthostomella pinea]
MSPFFDQLAYEPASYSASPAIAEYTTDPGLVANLVCRVLLGIVGTLLCWVPFRLLYRNGEFAAVVLIVDVAIMNFFTILNSLIWNSDNWDSWWDGTGLCDIEVYVAGPLQTIYAASIFTVMRNLAQLVQMARVNQLGRQEKTRRNLLQAAIIFPIPLVQLLFTYFDLAQRYIIGTLIGCSAVYDSSWPKNMVYDAPPALFALLAVPYAYLTWKRFRAISKKSQAALKSNTAASARANRTRQRLYYMSLSILAIYLPIMLYFLAINIQDTLSSYKEYSYARVHFSGTPYPWNSILFIPSWIIPGAIMNQPWVPIATTIAIVAFFGMTKDAMNMYRQYATSLKLDRVLREVKGKWDSLYSSRAEENGDTRSTVNSASAQGNKPYISNRRTSPDEHRNQLPRSTGATERAIFSRARSPVLPTVEPQPEPDVSKRHSHITLRTIGSQSPLESSIIEPMIPPRRSSLRWSALFRAPTMPTMPTLPSLPSLPRSLRLPSIPSFTKSRNASGASNASNRAHKNQSLSSRDDSFPMLPLQSFEPLAEMDAESPRTFASVTGKTSREAISPFEMGAREDFDGRRVVSLPRPAGGMRVRIPIIPSASMATARGGGDRTGNVDSHGFERTDVSGGLSQGGGSYS